MANKQKIKKKDVKKAVKIAKKYPKVIIALAIILVVAFILYCYFNPNFYNKLFNKTNYNQIDSTTIEVSNLVDLEIHIIDVGQGDSILIKIPDGKNVLIDAGDNSNSVKDKLESYFKENNVDTIDYLIATHSDNDHIGGMDRVFEVTEVKKVYRPYVRHENTSSSKYTFTSDFNQGETVHSTANYGEFLNCILDERHSNNLQCEWEFFTKDSDFSNNIVYENTTYTCTFDFLSPIPNLNELDYSDLNNYSPFIMLTYGDFKMLLTGDAETKAEEEFINAYKQNSAYVDCDVLKVGHHGSGTSTTQDFLNLIKPEYAVISCGEGNSYKHPHKEVLDRLVNLTPTCTLYRTDNNGDIVIKVPYNSDFSFNLDKESADNFLPGE